MQLKSVPLLIYIFLLQYLREWVENQDSFKGKKERKKTKIKGDIIVIPYMLFVQKQ